jgi:hypothetical protein
VGRPPAGRSGTKDYKARAIAWVEHHCADQNIPVKLSDPLALEKAAEILAQGMKRGVKRDSSKRL